MPFYKTESTPITEMGLWIAIIERRQRKFQKICKLLSIKEILKTCSSLNFLLTPRKSLHLENKSLGMCRFLFRVLFRRVIAVRISPDPNEDTFSFEIGWITSTFVAWERYFSVYILSVLGWHSAPTMAPVILTALTLIFSTF